MIPGDLLLYVVTPADVQDISAYNADVAAGDVAPAIVTKVHDAETVDMRVLFNGDVPPAWRTRVGPIAEREGDGAVVGWFDANRDHEALNTAEVQAALARPLPAAAAEHPGVPPELVPGTVTLPPAPGADPGV